MFSGILNGLKAFVAGIFAKEKAIVTQGLRKMQNAVQVDFDQLLQKGLPVAIELVGEAAHEASTGDEKFSQVATHLWQRLETDPSLGGLVQNDIHMLVQMAYRLGGKMALELKP